MKLADITCISGEAHQSRNALRISSEIFGVAVAWDVAHDARRIAPCVHPMMASLLDSTATLR